MRAARLGDAPAIMEVHRSAVRGIAASSYDLEVLDGWAPDDISQDRIDAVARTIEIGEELILVAEDEAGRIMGFGWTVPARSELRGLYVRAEHARIGIGRAILSRLETSALEAGIMALHLESSLNAQPFYQANGYVVIERGELNLPSGARMACVRMRKSLR